MSHIKARQAKRQAQIEKRAKYREAFSAYSAGMAIVSGVLVGSGIGYLLDKWLGTDPWLLIVFLLFGFAAGIKNMLWTVNRAGMTVEGYNDKKEDKEEKDLS